MGSNKFIFFVFAFSFAYNILIAQSDCPCCSDAHRQFDFWIGDWIVYDTVGNKIGENTVLKLEKECIINEHWRSVQGGTGRSYNYFNRADSTWNQLWIDSQGNNLELKGKAETNKMTLSSELLLGQKVDFYRNRITWTKNEDGSLTQLWEIVDKEDELLSTAFKGIYRKK